MKCCPRLLRCNRYLIPYLFHYAFRPFLFMKGGEKKIEWIVNSYEWKGNFYESPQNYTASRSPNPFFGLLHLQWAYIINVGHQRCNWGCDIFEMKWWDWERNVMLGSTGLREKKTHFRER
jgi:hypothetical protein